MRFPQEWANVKKTLSLRKEKEGSTEEEDGAENEMEAWMWRVTTLSEAG
jgi:hypothetical protein